MENIRIIILRIYKRIQFIRIFGFSRWWKNFTAPKWQLPPMSLLDEPMPVYAIEVCYWYEPLPAESLIPVYSYGRRVFTIERELPKTLTAPAQPASGD